MTPSIAPRAALLALGGLALLTGLNAALLLGGLAAPVEQTQLADRHGMVMVYGFLGSLIALERAVALRQGWGFLSPALLGASAVAAWFPTGAGLSALLAAQGSAVLVAVYVVLWRRSLDLTVMVQLVGAVAATLAAALWTRLPVEAVSALLVTFIVGTIAGERIELARLSMPREAARTGVLLVLGLLVAALASVLWPGPGGRLFGVLLAAGTVWLAVNDIARRTVRARGLPRFSAVGMLTGYLWLGVGALAWVALGRTGSGQVGYDLATHAVFLGFAMSMVLAHAPIILPAVLRARLPYHRLLYLPMLVLHLALLVRLGVADLGGRTQVWPAGGYASVAALLLIPLTLVFTALRRRRTDTDRRPTARAPARPGPGSPGPEPRPTSTPQNR